MWQPQAAHLLQAPRLLGKQLASPLALDKAATLGLHMQAKYKLGTMQALAIIQCMCVLINTVCQTITVDTADTAVKQKKQVARTLYSSAL